MSKTVSVRSHSSNSFEILQIGLIVTAVFFLQSPILGSDGFISGKALVLALTAMVGLSVLCIESQGYAIDLLDLVLLTILVLLGLSSFGAINSWNAAIGSVAMAASIAIYWISRSIALARSRSALLLSATVALGFVVLSAQIEAFTSLQFSIRPPGGTVGNRNRMAHLLVIGAPTLALLTTRVRNRWILSLLLLGSTSVGGALLLSRARGAWLAALAMAAVSAILVLLRRRAVNNSYLWPGRSQRLALFGGAAMIGVVVALFLPNQLNWASPTPYRDSAERLLEYQTGTGAGRLTEYRNTLKMIADHPILGVGPGNWRIIYPNYATLGDPNIQPGYDPVRRFPQGEWVGVAAERGGASLILLFLFGGLLSWRWLRAIVEEGSHRKVGYAYVGLLTMVAVFMVGLFDPVIMIPTAGFVVPVVLGVCASPFAQVRVWTPTPWVRRALISGVIVGGAFLVSFPARELWAAMTYAKRPTLEAFERASKIAPGDYRAHYFAASTLVQRGDCTRAVPYIEAARRLYPTAPAAVQLEERCVEIFADSSSGTEGAVAESAPSAFEIADQ